MSDGGLPMPAGRMSNGRLPVPDACPAAWWRRYFVVTENRLMLITSLADTDVGMMPLAKVTDMRLHQNTFGHMLGYAEFIVESDGQDQALSRIPFVPYPSQMYQEILSLIFSPKPQEAMGGLGPGSVRGIAGLPVGLVLAAARARRVTGDGFSSLVVTAARTVAWPGSLRRGSPYWGAAGYLLPGRRYALGRAPCPSTSMGCCDQLPADLNAR